MKKVIYIISDIDKALAFEWIVKEFKEEQIQLTFVLILSKPAQLEQFLKENNIPVYPFFYKSKKDFVSILYNLYKLLKKIKADAVHCHLMYGTLVGLTAAKLAGVKKRIFTRHHSDLHHLYFPSGIKWDKLCNTLATKIVAPTNAVKEILVGLEAVPDKKVITIPHGFDLNYFRDISTDRVNNLRIKYRTNDAYPIIGVISRFTEWKGIQYIIPAFSKLLIKYPNALILFFNANGDYATQINKQLEILPKYSYRLIPFENDLAAIYHLFTTFIHVPIDILNEAFGQIYVEALAAEIPSVFTLSGIAADFIVDGKNAMVVPFKNSEAIYNAVDELLTDRQLTGRLSKQGWESVKDKFALQTMTDKLKELYDAG